VRVVEVTRRLRPRYRRAIEALDAETTYPLGADRFRIDHGEDYFAFFDRLGDVHYFVTLDQGEVAGVAAGIVRRIPERAWYLCDLKVRAGHRGRHIPLLMLKRAFFPNYLRCRRGYAISMNKPGETENRIARLLSRFRWIPIAAAARLELFSLDAAAMRASAPLVARHRGPLSYLSLGGKKDIVLESTGAPMPLRHVQFGPCAEPGRGEPEEGCVHMLCAPEGDDLAVALRAEGHAASASATVIHHRMGRSDWRFILTSDI
jgi:hypothetical protein